MKQMRQIDTISIVCAGSGYFSMVSETPDRRVATLSKSIYETLGLRPGDILKVYRKEPRKFQAKATSMNSGQSNTKRNGFYLFVECENPEECIIVGETITIEV